MEGDEHALHVQLSQRKLPDDVLMSKESHDGNLREAFVAGVGLQPGPCAGNEELLGDNPPYHPGWPSTVLDLRAI